MDNHLSCKCYVCRTYSPDYRQQIDERFSLFKCPNCGLEYTYPIPADSELEVFYRNYHDIRADKAILELNAQENLGFLGKYGLTSESRILDYGAGDGIFVQVAGTQCYGVDWKPSSFPRMVKRVEDLPDWKWDFIAMWGVLEHLTNPVETVSRLSDMLERAGILVVTTVNAEGAIPFYYKPPEHLSYWTKRGMEYLANFSGLELIEYKPYFMFQLGAVYADRLLSRTPLQYKSSISSSLPDVVKIPTNEARIILRKPSSLFF